MANVGAIRWHFEALCIVRDAVSRTAPLRQTPRPVSGSYDQSAAENAHAGSPPQNSARPELARSEADRSEATITVTELRGDPAARAVEWLCGALPQFHSSRRGRGMLPSKPSGPAQRAEKVLVTSPVSEKKRKKPRRLGTLFMRIAIGNANSLREDMEQSRGEPPSPPFSSSRRSSSLVFQLAFALAQLQSLQCCVVRQPLSLPFAYPALVATTDRTASSTALHLAPLRIREVDQLSACSS
ncbi:hypothetical protein B0J13DRAFT_633289 [Dactylonectria estremocensis]|uniref:Uncharacterized protein n=1 Tax=Dactylonectria estremocensis TaxID=1079267 RepID=A0A9P9FHH7_9HYPO|nr:hypothetical protein B0J13DRAFT_633289 [Dactylonectria estremocensis]